MGWRQWRPRALGVVIRVRVASSIEDFIGLPGDPSNYADGVRSLWESGESRPEWCFLLDDDSGRVGRLGYRVEETCPREFLGALPPLELFGFGWWLPWDEGPEPKMRLLLAQSLERIGAEVPELLEIRVNREVHDRAELRVAVLERAGLGLFQEKQGYYWEGGPAAAPDRLTFRSLLEVGGEAYRGVMAPCGQGTLDRNDRYYWGLAGADNWASVMLGFAHVEDVPSWLLGYRDGDPVGYVALSAFDEVATATIAHIGVLPWHRGHGYVDDLLAAATLAARDRGFRAILSDVDVENAPMRAAMQRVGHREDARPWHVWAFRVLVSDLRKRD